MNGQAQRLATPAEADAAAARAVVVDASPAFLDAGHHTHPQHLPTRAKRELSRHLGFRVARKPSDLLAHTRRVLLTVHLEDPEATWGAVLDLFHVLGPRGHDLRRRLCNAACPILAPERRALLIGWLNSGEPMRLPLDQINRHCRLARASTGLALTRADTDRDAEPA